MVHPGHAFISWQSVLYGSKIACVQPGARGASFGAYFAKVILSFSGAQGKTIGWLIFEKVGHLPKATGHLLSAH